jgi:hypothetical protein
MCALGSRVPHDRRRRGFSADSDIRQRLEGIGTHKNLKSFVYGMNAMTFMVQ